MLDPILQNDISSRILFYQYMSHAHWWHYHIHMICPNEIKYGIDEIENLTENLDWIEHEFESPIEKRWVWISSFKK